MAKESHDAKKLRAKKIVKELQKLYPNVKCFLDYENPLQLLIAVMLSAQCTDVRVNMTTPALFKRFKSVKDFAAADILELEQLVRSTGFYKNKARNIKNMALKLIDLHGGKVPSTMDELSSLPGVGRKTANVVLAEIFDVPSMVVDTHVTRLSNRLGLVVGVDAVKLEYALMEIVEKKHWSKFSHWLISHGRAVCMARNPQCEKCTLLPLCPQKGL
jgi:endonuclease-3